MRQLQHRPVLDTLITSVENEGSAESTAKLLRCHPNTIRYRLRRLHELTGRYCWTRRVSRNWRLPPMH
ncbi:helix-turn-helix domain-containing protein [Mycolicibacterium sp. 120320]|uniref:helix-turn-helix domain-containing protein n=1 Tax=unclassified Mycolicibacterium TaxID=2636767 RepID=UPI003FA54F15